MLRPGKVPVRELLREAEALISHTFGPNIDFTVSPISDDLLVLADAGELQAAIINLAVNGRDALVDRGGHLRVSAHVAEPNASMTLAPGSYVVIVVEDSGPGMNETTIAQACDPFFTTKGPAESGLGLSMVQGFTRQSGGDLRIESAVGRGTRVEIWLPSANPTEVVGPSNTPMQEAFGGRILVVDDAPDVLVTVGAFLRHAGFAVTSVNSGDEAMAKLLSGDRFDAMVTDYAMHGLNGIDLLQQAREIDEAMPGLVISGFYGADSARSIDESLFLHKPFSRADLVERVRTMITRRRETAASAPSIAHRPA
jgi:CheY-like chemotaxis protein